MSMRFLIMAALLLVAAGCTGPVTESDPIPCFGCGCSGIYNGTSSACIIQTGFQPPMIEGSVVMPPSSQYIFSGTAGTPPYTYSVWSISGQAGTIDSTGKYTAPNTPVLNVVIITDANGSTATSQVYVSSSATAISVGIYRYSSSVEYGAGIIHFSHSYSVYNSINGFPGTLDNNGQPLIQVFIQSNPNTSQIYGCSVPVSSMFPAPINFNTVELNCPGSGSTVATNLGYIYSSQEPLSQQLYLCYDTFNSDYLLTFSQSCEGNSNYALEPLQIGFAIENY